MKKSYERPETEVVEVEVTTTHPILAASGPSPASDDDFPVVGGSQKSEMPKRVDLFSQDEQVKAMEYEKTYRLFED